MDALTSKITRIKDIISRNSEGNTALHLAVIKSKDLRQIKALIDGGAEINKQNNDGNTALQLAVMKSKDLRQIKALIDGGAEINKQNNDGNTALQLALMKSKDLSHVKALIDAGAEINKQNNDGNTALQLAVMKSKDLSHVKALIDAGADVNKQNSDGNTALHLCLINTKRFSLASLDPLVDESASERNVQPLLKHVVTVNENLLQDFDIAETLIDEGADLNIENNDGNTPLHLALINSKPSKLVRGMDQLNKQCPEDIIVCKLALQKSDVCRLVQKLTDKGADVDQQNIEGNTALHLALSSQLELVEAVYKMFDRHVDSYVYLLAKDNESRSLPYYEVVKFSNDFEKQLEILLKKSETICVKNKLGMDPIQMTIELIKSKDWYLRIFSMLMTLVPLLNLEYREHLTYSELYRKTLLHLINESYQYSAFITLKSVEISHLKFNVQNEAGNTPLHIASVPMVVYILSNCDNIDLFARNKRNETFLHTVLKSPFDYLLESAEFHDDYLKKFLQGQCKYCSKEDVKKLLCCRDIAGNTPLHVYISNMTHNSYDFVRSFYKAGADMNACNISKESILHYLARNNISEANIKFAIEHGAEVNAQNVFGESPIFVFSGINKRNICAIWCLIESGADLKICNKTGQNLLLSMNLPLPIMYYHNKSHIEDMIQKCSLKVIDIHGNSILHYVAWHGMYKDDEEYCDNVNLLLDAGAEIVQDALGQLPCYIAHQMGHVKLARILCKCDNTEHLDKFTFSERTVEFIQIMQDIQPGTFMLPQNFENYRKRFPITDILDEPFIGSVEFEGEAEEVQSCIIDIINDISKCLGDENILLKNNVVQSGSVSERTKIGVPDEFDFMCVFDILSEVCFVEKVSKKYPAYAAVKLKEECREDQCRSCFDKNCYFNDYTFNHIFMTALKDTVQCLDIYSHPNIIFKRIEDMSMGPNVELHFVWTGHKYKGMKIKVDLVPVIQIKGWWPDRARLDSLACDTEQTEQLRKDGALLLLRRRFCRGYLQISSFTAEKMHLKNLSQEARNAYIIAKILCSNRVCPILKHPDLKKKNISSYILKNSMFHIIDNTIESVYDYVCKIFRYFIECTKTGNLPSYVYPDCNIFASAPNVVQLDFSEMQMHWRIYSQIILNIIRSTEEYLPTDFDELFNRYVRYAEETRLETTEHEECECEDNQAESSTE